MLAHLLKKLTNLSSTKNKSTNSIFKNMAILASGAIFARIISLGSTPMLTRIYSPSDFGVLAIFLAVIALAVPLSSLRYSVAIPLLKNDNTAMNLLFGTFLILMVVSFLSFFILYFFSIYIFDIFSINSLQTYWILIPIAIFGSGFYEILKSWGIRQGSFKNLAKTEIYITAIGSIVKIMMGLIGFKPLGLLLGAVLTNILGVFPLAITTFLSMKYNFKYIKIIRIKFLLKRYIEYPKYRLPSQFILVMSQQAPLLILGSLFGSETVGQFSLALMALSLPISLLGTTMGQAYYSEVAKIGRKNPKKIFEISVDIVKRLFLFSIVPFLVILFFSPWIFNTVFGDAWVEAGEYARILSIYMLTSFISGPIVNVLSIFEKQLLFLRLNIIRVIILFITFALSSFLNVGSFTTVLFYSISMSFFFLYITFFIFNFIKKEIIVYNGLKNQDK